MAHILPGPPRTWDYRTASPPPACPHGTAYAQPCYGCGWTCPACKRSYAPWVRECSYRHENGGQPAPAPVLPAGEGEPAASGLRLPGKWHTPGYQHFVRACGEWREVTPGLQVLLGQRASDGEEAILRFRLTPDGTASDPAA